MSKQTEIENIARCLFEIEISLGQLSAYKEGHDKLFGLPIRSEWINIGYDSQRCYIEQAKNYIKEQGRNIEMIKESDV
jgi:hypothetical protein